jgi:magnesium transporter
MLKCAVQSYWEHKLGELLEEKEGEGLLSASNAAGAAPVFLSDFIAAVEQDDIETIRKIVATLHPADAADFLRELPVQQRGTLLRALHAEMLSAVLSYCDETLREEALHELGVEKLASAVAELDTDDAVEFIDELDEEDQQTLLAAIPTEERIILQQTLNYPESSAGRLMQRELVAVPSHWNVGQTIDFLRGTTDLPDDFYEIFVLDAKHKPVGTIPLSRLLRTRRPAELKTVMLTDFRKIPLQMDQEEVAFLFRKYSLVSAAVVSENGDLVGVITVDDVVQVIQEEAGEDILKLAGVSGQEDFYRATFAETKARFWWLFVNLFTAVLASWVISLFDGSIQKIVVLAVLMPIVASMGGNAGTQTVTVVVRALAMRQISKGMAKKVLFKEGVIGLLNGLMFAAVAGIVSWFWYHDAWISFVLAAAMIVNLLAASLAGTIIPLALRRMGADPAIASVIFLTTVTDVVGFLAFLGMATAFLL